MEYIFSEMINNAFRMSWDFELDGIMRNTIAVFDTGCTHSMVSANCVYGHNISDTDKRRMKLNDIRNKSIELCIARGVESQSDEKKKELNAIQVLVDKRNKDINSLTIDEQEILLDCEQIKFKHKIKYHYIAGYFMCGGEIQISYDFDNVVLIGMEFIKELYVIIGTRGGKTLLFAKYKISDGLDTIFKEAQESFSKLQCSADEEYIDFYDTQTMKANYVQTNEIARLAGKEEAYLELAERILNNSINRGKQLSKKKAIKYLTEILLISEEIANQAYNNCTDK